MAYEQKKREYTPRKIQNSGLDTMVYGKIPPQAKELEEAILGAMMLERTAIDEVTEYLHPKHFYAENHKTIYQAILDLHGKGWPVDILTVTQLLQEKEQLEIVGGAYAVTKLTNSVVSGANIRFHSNIILDKYTKRELIRMGGQLINGGYEEGIDVKELINEHEKAFTELTLMGGDQYSQIDAAMVSQIQRIESLRHKDEEMSGITSGFPSIDRITFGWQKTDLIILAARPAVGKTALALNLARNAAMHPKYGGAVAIFSLEMSTGQLVQRIMAAESEIWLEKIARAKMEEEDMKKLYNRAIQPLANKTLLIDDTPMLNIFELRAKARRMKRKHGIQLLIVDYLQLMSGDTNDSKNREREIAQISRGLKGLAKELEIPVIALSQLSREPDKRKGDAKTPQLTDLRESGAIEQDADMVMFMYRPEYYDVNVNEMGESTKGETHISIAKHRNGKLAMGNEAIKLKANLAIQKFFEFDAMDEIKQQFNNGQGSWRPVTPSEKGEELPFD